MLCALRKPLKWDRFVNSALHYYRSGGDSWKRVATLALLVWAAYAVAGWFNPFPLTWGDAHAYIIPAKAIVYRGEMLVDNYFSGIAPPLYSLLMIPAVLFGTDDTWVTWGACLINAACVASLVPLAYLFGNRLLLSFGQSTVCALFICIAPHMFQFTQDIMSENVYIPLFGWALWCALQPQDRRMIIASTALLSLMALTKPIAAVPILTIALWSGARSWRERGLGGALALLMRLGVLPICLIVGWLQWSEGLQDLPPELRGSYPPGYSEKLALIFSHSEAFVLFIQRLLASVGYTILGALFLPLALLFSHPYAKDRLPSVRADHLLLLFLWLGMASLSALAQFIFFKNPLDGRYFLYGRYLDPILPVILIYSFAELIRLLRRLRDSAVGEKWIISSAIGLLVFLLLVCYPLQFWSNNNSGAITAYVMGKLTEQYWHLQAAMLAVLVATLLRVQSERSLGAKLAVVVVLFFLGATSVKEMQRANDWKTKQRNEVTMLPVVVDAPPSTTSRLIVADDVGHQRAIWLFGYIYQRARIYPRSSFPREVPPGSIVFSRQKTPLPRTKRCGILKGDISVFCSRPRRSASNRPRSSGVASERSRLMSKSAV